VKQTCRGCGAPTRRLEVSGRGVGPVFFPIPPAVESELGDDFDWESDPRWLCRFIDALACPDCGQCDLAVADPQTYLNCDGPHLPQSSVWCRACSSACRGPLEFECYGAPGVPLAYLAPNYGAPLVGRLCVACGRVWLCLYPDDSKGRMELEARFPDSGCCTCCGRGRLRATNVEVPHGNGFGALYDPGLPSGKNCVADWLVSVCDSCGEAEARAGWL
jgi:hypothetical protein